MRLKEYEIVIEPREVIFEHIQVGKVFTKTLNIKNVGDRSKRMELFRPNNKAFKLNVKNPVLPVPPGMEIAATVEFQANQNADFTDELVVSIDNKEVKIPLIAFPAKPILKTDSVIDFGTHAANNKTISVNLKISNSGAKDGDYVFKYKGEHVITFTPNMGTIPPYSDAFVRVDFFTKSPCILNENISLMFQGSDKPHIINIKANIMTKGIEILNPETSEKVKNINFGSCYYGCNLTNLVILFNNSPEPCDYVIVLEQNGLGAEIGAELSKSTKALKAEVLDYKEENFCEVDKLVSAYPNNGHLEPFEKRPVFLRFSPQFSNPQIGFQTTLKPPPRRDYAVFLYFEMLGSHQKTEVAITGTALPVLLRSNPQDLNFGSCYIGNKKDILVTLSNDSDLKDVKFKFNKVANFVVQPASGRIRPRSNRDVVVSFIPHQPGVFSYTLNCEVIDKIADRQNPLMVFDKKIDVIKLKLTSEAIPLTVIPEPKHSGDGVTPRYFVTGMDPIITNEVGLNVTTTVGSVKPFMPRAAVLNAPKDKLHKNSYAEKIQPGKEHSYRIAYPNDRTRSIAPFKRDEKYKTLFTGVDRYNYVDEEYAYTNEEIKQIEKQKLLYRKYVEDLQYYRAEKTRIREYHKNNNSVNIGLIPGEKIRPQTLSLKDIEKEAAKIAGFQVNSNWKLISSEEIDKQKANYAHIAPKEGLPSIPSNIKDREKCMIKLAPAELYKIIVTPDVIDFGEIAVRSTSIKNLDFINTLDQPIQIDLDINCIELRHSSPLSQVIPAQSKASFPIVFESKSVQTFQRSISYRINNCYEHHVIVFADSKQPTLNLNHSHIVLSQLTGNAPELCYRSNITIKNPYNTISEFTWMPVYGDQGTAFSIRPATGTVDPLKELECEIVWHGSYLAPLEGSFSLLVQGGEPNKLTCEAKLGTPQVQFISRRVSLGKIPINLNTVRTFYMINTGTNHAYFQVLDSEPIAGMIVSPKFGMVPVGGSTSIRVEMNLSEIVKFDARIFVQIRGGKTLELRLSGESEEPNVDISIPNFNFGGVFSGASLSMPFELINRSKVRAAVEFDLSKFNDFAIQLIEKNNNDENKEIVFPDNNYKVLIGGEQSLKLSLTFSPSEVSSYDFELPIYINKLRQKNSLRDYEDLKSTMDETKFSEFLKSSYQENATPTFKSTRLIHGNYPQRKVIAIGLRPALKLSTTKIRFEVPLVNLERLKHGGFYEAKSILMTNYSHKKVKWCLDMRKANSILEKGIFQFMHGSMIPFVSVDGKSPGPEGEIQSGESFQIMVLFCPDVPGKYECKIPIVVNDNFDKPYYNIEVYGEILTPTLVFEPDILVMKPIPLGLISTEKILIKALNYENISSLNIEIPPGIANNGEKVDVINASFIGDSKINPGKMSESKELEISFNCSKPISSTIKLKFIDSQNNEYFYNVVVTADNSLFTCYGFLAEHQTDYQIVLEEGKIMKGTRNTLPSRISGVSGEPILRPCSTSSRLSRTQTTTPTFDVNGSQFDSTTDANEVLHVTSASQSKKTENRLITPFSRTQESVMFPNSDTESGVFSSEVLKSLQRWFACNGWPNSYNPVRIPESFRGGLTRKPIDNGLDKIPSQDAIKSDNKTIYDMIAYISGRPLPGIPVSAPTPNDLEERTKQFYWQHSVLLMFIKTQGGCIEYIRPEYLLDQNEFKLFITRAKELQTKIQNGYKDSKQVPSESVDVTIETYEPVSKKAWLDTLLQIVKTLILGRVTPKSFKNLPLPESLNEPFPEIKSDPLTSNIYSIGERILLTWLNHCYASFKDKIWVSDDSSQTPTSRWIVNFDIDITDSLAIGATFGAYCPFLIESHLRRMYVIADTAEKCFHNALILVECSRYIGLVYDINALDLTDPNPITISLFCAYLYENLPNYLPKSSVDFSGALGETLSKNVKISNPSKKNIMYQALIIGPNSECFHLPKGSQILLPSKSKMSLQVNYQGKNLRTGNAYLVLISKKEDTTLGSTLCFCLKTSISELTTKKIVKFESPLYKLNETIIEIQNPYSQSATFNVKIIESDNKSGTIKNPFDINNCEKDSRQSQNNEPILSAFFTSTSSLDLNAHGACQLKINYLPLQFMKRTAVLVLSNEKIGEFIYYLEGNVTQPDPFKVIVDEKRLDSDKCKLIKSTRVGDNKLYFRCYSGDQIEVNIQIPVCNMQRENALVLATQMRMSEEELRKRKFHGILSSKSLLEALETLTLNKNSNMPQQQRSNLNTLKKLKQDNEIVFEIESTSQTNTFNHPKILILTQEECKDDRNMMNLTFRFSSERHGTFPTYLLLKSLPDDIRTISIELKVTDRIISDSSTAHLEFNTCVFDPITQPIPIKNGSENTCNYEAHISVNGDNEVFTGLKSFSVKPKETFTYELTFDPSGEDIFHGILRLINTTEGVELKYDLTGTGERPPPLGDIKCESQVGEITHHEIMIPNKSNKKICFYVQSSAPLIRGPDKIMILPNRKQAFKFDICPSHRGQFKGVVAFRPGEWPIKDIDSDGEEIITIDSDEKPPNFTLWFAFDVKVSPPQSQSTIEIIANNFETTCVQIPLSNPFSEKITLNIYKDGKYLDGASSFDIEPKSRSFYELKFRPKQIGIFKGSLIFFNEETGEFWYDLKLISNDPLVKPLPQLECEVGKSIRSHVKLENPLAEVLEFQTYISNPDNFLFDIKQNENILIEANQIADVPFVFTPSTVGKGNHFSQIIFYNDKVGKIQYDIECIGLKPTIQDTIYSSADVGSTGMFSVNFKNPTDSAIYIDLDLKDSETYSKEDDATFTLLLNNNTSVRIPPKERLDIPIMFCPEQLKQYKWILTIIAKREAQMSWTDARNDDSVIELKWIYPLVGVATVHPLSPKNPLVIESMIRNRLEKRIELSLTSFGNGDRNLVRSITPYSSQKMLQSNLTNNENQQLSFSLKFLNSAFEEAAKNSIAIKLVRVEKNQSNDSTTCIFDVIFSPSKSFSCDVNLVIVNSSGGNWNYPLRFVSLDAPPDDTIVIEAVGLNQESIVGFRLNSKSEYPLPFEAHLSPSGDQVFDVLPNKGELLPLSANGTLIRVSFKPPAYGRLYQTQLIISTTVCQWKYIIKGVTPEYVKPNGRSKGAFTADSNLRAIGQSEKKNYILENKQLNQTAVSSPIKGASLVQMRLHNYS